MGTVDAGTIEGSGRVKFRTTVHGPVTGYAKVGGKHRRGLAQARELRPGHPLAARVPRPDAPARSTRPQTLRDAMATSPFTFNVGYADDRDIAMYSAGKLPMRDSRVDPRLPTKGTGEYEWKGFLRKAQHPFQVNPPSGTLVNWNNRPAPGWGAADDNWSYGSVAARADARRRPGQGADARPRVVTVGDERGGDAGPAQRRADAGASAELLTAAPAPSAAGDAHARAARRRGARRARRRLDRDLDGMIDAGPGPAIWDAFYPRLFDGGDAGRRALGASIGTRLRHRPAASPTAASGTSRRTCGRLNGDKLKRPFNARYCGGGDRAKCAAAVWKALDAVPGDPDALRADANAERIAFRPGLLPTTIRYTNRPSGIQQVISFAGHRPR